MAHIVCWPHSTGGISLVGKSGKVYTTDNYGNFECPEEDARGFMEEHGAVGLQCIPPLPPKVSKPAPKPAPKAAKPVAKAEKKVEKKAAPVKKSSAPKKSAKKAPAKKSSSKKG